MDAKRARIASEEARRWHEAGLVTEEALKRIEAAYQPHLRPEAERMGAGYGALALYGAAGALLGAACLVFVGLGEFGRADPYVLLALGALLAGGAGASYALQPRRELADALLVAALVPWTAAPFPQDDPRAALALLALLPPIAILLWRQSLLPLLAATIAFSVAAATAAFDWTDAADNIATSLWLSLVLLWTGGLLAVATLHQRRGVTWIDPLLAVATAALAAPTVAVLFDGFDFSSSEAVELVLGAVQLLLIGLGLALRQRGVVIGASAVLTMDALVFAFDAGGPRLGTGILIVTAIGLLLLATMLRGRERDA